MHGKDLLKGETIALCCIEVKLSNKLVLIGVSEASTLSFFLFRKLTEKCFYLFFSIQ